MKLLSSSGYPDTASFHCPVITYNSDFFGKYVTINPATRVLISGTKWVEAELPFGEPQSNCNPEVKHQNPDTSRSVKKKKKGSPSHGGKDDKRLWSNQSF